MILNSQKRIDLRSDTVTMPSEEMRKAIYAAQVGDMGFGEDNATVELEAYCADYFGKEAALFMSSGTMSDQVAICSQTSPGEEIIIDSKYHINYFQAGSTTSLGKVCINAVQTEDGILTQEYIEKAVEGKYRNPQLIKPSLVCLENTINVLGGKIFPINEMRRSSCYARENNMRVHLDGARLLNACASTEISPKKYASYADTVSICLSKGLGAPFGSILVGDCQTISKAVRHRRWCGGGLHQSGFMAAAALYAMKNNVEHLKQDNENANKLACILHDYKDNPFNINLSDIETNMVLINTNAFGIDAHKFVDLSKERGLMLYPWTKNLVRAVTNLNVSQADVEKAGEILIDIFVKYLDKKRV